MPGFDRFHAAVRRLIPPAAESDAALLARFAADRDEAAFAALVARHGPMVLGVCRRVLGCPHAAEDACQAVFLVLARRAPALRLRRSIGDWLHGVARRAAMAARRAAARRRTREADAAVRPRAGLPAYELAELWAVLDCEIARLPEKYRAVLILADLGGMDRRQVATELGVAEGTVASRQARARAILARRLGRLGWGPAGYLAAVAPGDLSAAAARAAAALAVGGGTTGGLAAGPELLATEVLTAMTRAKWGLAAAGAAAVLAISGVAVGLAGDGPGAVRGTGYSVHAAGGSALLLDPATGDTWLLSQPAGKDPTWIPVRRPEAKPAPTAPAATPEGKAAPPAHTPPPGAKGTQPGATPLAMMEYAGRLALARTFRTHPKTEGTVEWVKVKVGDRVKAGQVLIQLDSRDARLALDAARAGLVAAQANLPRPDMEKTGLVGPSVVRRAEAEVKRAEVEVERAQFSQQATTLRAAADGTVTELTVQDGDPVKPGQVVAVVADLRDVVAEVQVAESDAGRVAVGQACVVRVIAGGVEYPGVVARLGTIIDPATATLEVRVKLRLPEGIPAGGAPPRAGSFVTVRFEGKP